MKYQDIETILRTAGMHPEAVKVIQHLHAENVGLKQEISGICKGIDLIIQHMNDLATVSGMHQQVLGKLADGKSMSDIVAEMRAEHLSGVESEEIKQ